MADPFAAAEDALQRSLVQAMQAQARALLAGVPENEDMPDALAWQALVAAAVAAVQGRLLAALQQAALSSLVGGAAEAAGDLEAAGTLDPALLAQTLATVEREHLPSIQQTSRDALAGLYDKALAAGWTVALLRRAVRQQTARWTHGTPAPLLGLEVRVEARVTMIARTTVTAARAAGAQMAGAQAERAGAQVQKRWVTRHDDRVEARCLRNEAAGWIPLDGWFPTGATQPPEHPRCRCRIETRIV